MTITYSRFAPTQFDSRGACLPDRQEWIVVPVSQTRDSGPLDQSNFSVALAILGGESETVEVHRFGHWGPGWFDLILVHPSRESNVESIASALDDYPVLCDEDFSDREYEACASMWESIPFRERIELCGKWSCSIFAARRNELPESFRAEDLTG